MAKPSAGRRRRVDLLSWVYDGGCFWCGHALSVEITTLDELLPRSRGGLRAIHNQVPCHLVCNQARGSMVAPRVAFQRHYAALRAAGFEPGGTLISRRRFLASGHPAAEEDSPMSNSTEDAQGRRDQAERDRERARAGQAATTDNNRDAVAEEAKQGRGPAGLNTGPSNTVDADPHNPRSNAPLYRPGQETRHDGMGVSPPQGAAVTSDKPELAHPAQDRAARLGEGVDPKGQELAQQGADEHKQAQRDERKANEKLGDAQKDIAKHQEPGPTATKRDDDRDKR